MAINNDYGTGCKLNKNRNDRGIILSLLEYNCFQPEYSRNSLYLQRTGNFFVARF